MLYAFDEYWIDGLSNTDLEYAPPEGAPPPRLMCRSEGQFSPCPVGWARLVLRMRVDWMRASGMTEPDVGLDVRSLERVLEAL